MHNNIKRDKCFENISLMRNNTLPQKKNFYCRNKCEENEVDVTFENNNKTNWKKDSFSFLIKFGCTLLEAMLENFYAEIFLILGQRCEYWQIGLNQIDFLSNIRKSLTEFQNYNARNVLDYILERRHRTYESFSSSLCSTSVY